MRSQIDNELVPITPTAEAEVGMPRGQVSGHHLRCCPTRGPLVSDPQYLARRTRATVVGLRSQNLLVATGYGYQAFAGDLPGSRRSPCLGCGEIVKPARHAHVQIGGRRDGTSLVVFEIFPQRASATNLDSLFSEGELYLLGWAHRTCVEQARERLERQEVLLPGDLPRLRVEETEGDLDPLHVRPTGDHCAFCGSREKMTMEHVWPEWITRLLGQNSFTITAQGQERRSRQIDLVAPVCATCNNRWLSVLEGDVQPVLAPMIRGEDRSLDLREQRLLATWAAKTALMLALVQDGSGIPEGYYHDLRLRREPLPSHAIWLGAYCDNRWAGWSETHPLRISVPEDALPNGFVTTFTAFRVVFQVVGHFASGEATIRDTRWQFAPAIHQLWPAGQEEIAWPRGGYALGDESLRAFARSFTDTTLSGEPSAPESQSRA